MNTSGNMMPEENKQQAGAVSLLQPVQPLTQEQQEPSEQSELPELLEQSKQSELLQERLLQIPDKTLKNIDFFGNRYLGFILKTVYASYPDTQSTIDAELVEAIENKQRDKAQSLIDEANLPLYPNHAKLEDFNPTCLNEQDQELFQRLKTLDFMFSDCPNITLLGPQNFGAEKLASGFGDAICHKLHSVYYTKFQHLISMLITHGSKTARNNEYDKLMKKDCLIIEDFAGIPIHDRDLLAELYSFLDARISSHLKLFNAAKGKKQPMNKACITIITTCRAYEEWYSFFDCDKMKAVSLATLFHGYGEILSVDEAYKEADAVDMTDDTVAPPSRTD